MEPSSQFKSWKRTIDSQEDEERRDTRNFQESRRENPPESKRPRPDIKDEAYHGCASQTSSFPTYEPHSVATGHSYGPSNVHGNARVQNGDSYYNAGPSSQIWGPSVLNGEMRVHLSNVYHTYNYGPPNPSTKEAQEQALKSLLYYSTMDDRKAQLKAVDPASFQWIWSQSSFLEWLTSNGGSLFWISGKPASGKSTLMHYLSDNRHGSSEVMRRLENSGKSWLMTRFYFDFRAGTGIANTTLGMLRSLLSQLIDKSTEVKDFVLKHCQHRLQGNWPELEAELLELFCEAVESTHVSICGFVDGLDEYKGSLLKLVDFILIIQRRIGAKICLASRPETELSYRLHGSPTFAMQDYNQGTIKAYIESAIANIGHFVPLRHLHDILEEKVVAHADGVILWAIFSVDEAVKATLHGCTTDEIQQRISSFPQELTSVYRRIWDKLSSRDQELAAVILFVVQYWRSSFDWDPALPSLNPAHLTCCCRAIVRRLDPNFVLDADYSDVYFRLKIYAILGGLVEFSGEEEIARLAHKSVGSFLENLEGYVRQTGRISQVVDLNLLGPRFFADILHEACDAFIPDFDYLTSLYLESTGSNWLQLEEILLQPSTISRFQALKRRQRLDCEIVAIKSALVSAWMYATESSHLTFGKLGRASHYAAFMVSLSQTWLMQHYVIPIFLDTSILKLLISRSLKDLSKALCPLLGEGWIESTLHDWSHPELLYLAENSCHSAVKLVAQQAELSKGIEYELIVLILIQLHFRATQCDLLDPAEHHYISSVWNGAPPGEEEIVEAELRNIWNRYLSRI